MPIKSKKRRLGLREKNATPANLMATSTNFNDLAASSPPSPSSNRPNEESKAKKKTKYKFFRRDPQDDEALVPDNDLLSESDPKLGSYTSPQNKISHVEESSYMFPADSSSVNSGMSDGEMLSPRQEQNSPRLFSDRAVFLRQMHFPRLDATFRPRLERRNSIMGRNNAVLSDIEKLAQKKGTNTEDERFKVVPSYAYPRTKLNREELRQEMNKPSVFYHDYRKAEVRRDEDLTAITEDTTLTGKIEDKSEDFGMGNRPRRDTSSDANSYPNYVGSLHVEILQCFGIPRPDIIKETSAFCIVVCGSHAFKSDVMPPVANPMWLCKMRRAAVFPLRDAYSKAYIGVFANRGDAMDFFIGRVVISPNSMRPGCTYDVTLPLRQSSTVYSRQSRGAIRVRFHLEWHNDRRALLSYLPIKEENVSNSQRNLSLSFTSSSTSSSALSNASAYVTSFLPQIVKPKLQPHDSVTIRCCDNKSFQNVARVVHGHDLPDKFSMKLVKATMREVNFIRIHVMRYLRKQQLADLKEWRYPLISCFVFVAWMHSVYTATIRYLPGHIVTFLLLQLWKNYAIYVVDGEHNNGFSAPTFEEMFFSLFLGKDRPKRKYSRERSSRSRVQGSKRISSFTNKEGNSYFPGYIQPLTMERKDPTFKCQDAVNHLENESENDNAPQQPSLHAIARALRFSVKVATNGPGYNFFKSTSSRTFLGTDAVDFLVEKQFATNRREATDICIRLQKELRLFEHVGRKYDFKDAEIYYVFLNVDTSEYVFKTHKPWLKSTFSFLGFRRDIKKGTPHLEFPYSTGLDHPRFTVRDSLVVRSKESKNLLQTMKKKEEKEDVDELGVTAYKRKMDAKRQLANLVSMDPATLTQFPQQLANLVSVDPAVLTQFPQLSKLRAGGKVENTNHPEKEVDIIENQDDDGEDIEDDGIEAPIVEMLGDVEIKILQKPPNQDIDFKKKGAKTMADQMVETRHKCHQMCGHFFNDRAYKLSLDGDGGRRQSRRRSRSYTASGKAQGRRFFRTRKRRSNRKGLNLDEFDDPEEAKRVALSSRKEEYDRLLHTGKYSHNNVIVSKVAVIIQPIIEIFQLFLGMFRVLFNVFTWRDPFFTFWVVCFGSVLVVVLHLFPWRIALGIAGIALTGPQNWVIRIVKERKNGGPLRNDMDTIFRKRKGQGRDDGDTVFNYFSSKVYDNQPILEEMLDKSEFKEVAIPHTALSYHRFYDWPPEPAYARVWSCEAPSNQTDDLHEPIGDQLCSEAFSVDNTRGWSGRRKNLVRGVFRAAKKPKRPKIRRRRKQALERLSESTPLA